MIEHVCKDQFPFIISTHDAFCFAVSFAVPNKDEQADKNLDFKSVEILKKHVDWDKMDIPEYQTKF